MSKNIVFCADGTWNGPGEPDSDDKTAPPTNVFKLFLNLDGKDTPGTYLLEKEQERALQDANGVMQQIAKYLHGVGDSDNFLVHLLGGTLGAGLITRIVRGYTFISRNYVAGDRIFIIGFSRGAYTARALGGMIAAQGLLDASRVDLTDRELAYRLGTAVWYQYRRAALEADASMLQRLEDTVLDIPGLLDRLPSDDLLTKAPIEAIAVWDTVGALGIPEYTRTMLRIDVFRFADTSLSAVVRHGIQALAVDERREDFTPTLWDADARITQALFPGAHSDVGGGEPDGDDESGLSDRTLAWMIAQLSSLGVLFSATPAVTPHPDPRGTAHEPWLHLPWNVLPRGPRAFPAGLSLSQCVIDRINGSPVVAEPQTAAVPYAPANLAAYLNGKAAAPGVILL
jgi:uncharacterized protein (DUF2235 family)